MDDKQFAFGNIIVKLGRRANMVWLWFKLGPFKRETLATPEQAQAIIAALAEVVLDIREKPEPQEAKMADEVLPTEGNTEDWLPTAFRKDWTEPTQLLRLSGSGNVEIHVGLRAALKEIVLEALRELRRSQEA